MRFSKYPLNIYATSFDSEKSSQFLKNFLVEMEIEILESNFKNENFYLSR